MNNIPYLEHVVAVDIAKITTDLCSHVPATEGSSWELHTSHVKHHVGDSRKSVPTQTKPLKPVIAEDGWRETERGGGREG